MRKYNIKRRWEEGDGIINLEISKRWDVNKCSWMDWNSRDR